MLLNLTTFNNKGKSKANQVYVYTKINSKTKVKTFTLAKQISVLSIKKKIKKNNEHNDIYLAF